MYKIACLSFNKDIPLYPLILLYLYRINAHCINIRPYNNLRTTIVKLLLDEIKVGESNMLLYSLRNKFYKN